MSELIKCDKCGAFALKSDDRIGWTVLETEIPKVNSWDRERRESHFDLCPECAHAVYSLILGVNDADSFYPELRDERKRAEDNKRHAEEQAAKAEAKRLKNITQPRVKKGLFKHD